MVDNGGYDQTWQDAGAQSAPVQSYTAPTQSYFVPDTVPIASAPPSGRPNRCTFLKKNQKEWEVRAQGL